MPGESIAPQHRLLIADLTEKRKRVRRRKRKARTKWWKLKEEGQEYIERLAEYIESKETSEWTWGNTYQKAVELAKEELGETSGGKYLEKESWFWNSEVQEAVEQKRAAFKEWQRTKDRQELDPEEAEAKERDYREKNKTAKERVAIAKEKGYEKLYEDLKENGPKNLYKLAKTRKRRSQDIDRMIFVKDREGKILCGDDDIKKRWREYFDKLLNTKNRRKDLERNDRIEGPMRPISESEVKIQLEKMKNRKATGPDEFPIEVVKSLGQTGLAWMTAVLQDVQENGIPPEWRKSKITPLYKQKGDPLNCSNYRGIKLLSHCLKLYERVIEARLREMSKISSRQYGFQKGKSTTQPMFCLRILQEKMREHQKDIHMVFVDLEKAYDTVPRDLIWYCLRKRGVPEAYVSAIKDMYKDCKTSVVTSVGETDEMEIEVGLHQGSALSPYLFIMILDVITEEIQEDTPWAMLFADDLVLCDETRERMEERLENWRGCLEDAGLKVSRSKTEHLPPAGNLQKIVMKEYDGDGSTDLPQVSTFKYLGTTIDREGGCGTEIAKRIEKAWNRWRELTGVLCDKKIPTKLKVLLYKTAIKPTLMYGNEIWPLTQRQEDKISATEMRMLRHIYNVDWEDHITNDSIREEAKIEAIAIGMRRRRLQWYGHVRRRDREEDIRMVAEMRIQGKRKRGRPKKRWMDTVKDDMLRWGLSDEDVDDRIRWHSLIELGALQDRHPSRTTAD